LLPPGRPTCRPDPTPLSFPVPSTASLVASPVCDAMSPAPRFRSQAFSTSQRFPASFEFRGPVSCHNRSWDPPFRVFPSQRSRTPLEAASSLAVIHPRARTHCSRPYHRQFPRRPRFHAVAWFPRRLQGPFPQTRVLASRFPWVSDSEAAPFRQLHLLRSLTPPANPFALARVAPDQWPILSWVSAPLELSPSAPRILDPPEPGDSNTRLCPKTQARDPEDLSTLQAR
jgi:hypothetical protein